MLPNLNVLWPTFVLVALIFVIWFTMIFRRLGHMRRTPPGADTFASGDAAKHYFTPVALPGDNLANLFELPVLFFALVPLLLITRHANHIQVILAWAFVILRAVHSFIHIGPNKVGARFIAWLLSCAVLLAMWLGFFIDVIHAQAVISSVPLAA